MQALKCNDSNSSKFNNEEEINSYNEGYSIGTSDLETEKSIAYEAGYTEKGYSVSEKFSIAEEVIMTSYKYGEEELRLEKKKKSQVIISTVVILLVAGGLLVLIGVNILSFIIIIFTLGIASPAALCMKYRWIYKHTIIEGKRLKFVGSGMSLFGHFIKRWFFTLITFGIYGFWLSIKIRQWEVKNVQFE